MNDGVAGDDFLLGFASWRDNPHAFMRMPDATVSLKTRKFIINRSICKSCKMAF